MSDETDGSGEQQRGVGGRLVTRDGRELPLRGVKLEARAGGGIARATLQQTFVNDSDEPLTVEYLLPLPADGAVSGYSFCIDDVRIVGEVQGRDAARERFEQAIAEGHSAALLEQQRSSLFTQEIGNIGAGARVVAEIVVDQKLAWLDERVGVCQAGAWEWRFPTVLGPRYVGAPGRVADVAAICVDVSETDIGARGQLELVIVDDVVDGAEAERVDGAVATPRGAGFDSPSHALDVAVGKGYYRVRLAGDAAKGGGATRLDRDLVVRWRVAREDVGVSLEMARPAAAAAPDGSDRVADDGGQAYGLLTLVPPAAAGAAQHAPVAHDLTVARDLTVLLDTSGSMSGAPLAQAARIASALIETLGERDRLELIAFGNEAMHFQREAVKATKKTRKAALAWLRQQRAGGGTEMLSGLRAALAPLDVDSQRQVVLLTDGYIGFEQQVISELLAERPQGVRLHAVGVGPAVNRTLTAGLARAGRGAEIIIGLDEDTERAVTRLSAATTAPVVVDLSLSGSALREHAPTAVPDLYAGQPALVALALDAAGGTVEISGRVAGGERFSRTLTVGPVERGEGRGALRRLFARERVEDLETELCAGGDAESIEAAIAALGVHHQISTRLTSWIAVSDEPTIGEGQIARRQRVPHEVPAGLSVQGLGLRAPYDMSMKTLSGVGSPLRLQVMHELMASTPMSSPQGAPPQLHEPSSRKRPSRIVPLLLLLLLLGGLSLLIWWLLS